MCVCVCVRASVCLHMQTHILHSIWNISRWAHLSVIQQGVLFFPHVNRQQYGAVFIFFKLVFENCFSTTDIVVGRWPNRVFLAPTWVIKSWVPADIESDGFIYWHIKARYSVRRAVFFFFLELLFFSKCWRSRFINIKFIRLNYWCEMNEIYIRRFPTSKMGMTHSARLEPSHYRNTQSTLSTSFSISGVTEWR